MSKGQHYRGTKTDPEASDCLRTPIEIARWLNRLYDFTVDLAADDYNSLCADYFSQDGKGVGSLGDGLTDDWTANGLHKVGFCNPPYSDIGPWITKAAFEAKVHGFTTIMLIPTFNGDKWAKLAFAASREIIFINGRLAFLYPDGAKKGNNRGSMICVIGPGNHVIPSFSTIERSNIFANHSEPTPQELAAQT